MNNGEEMEGYNDSPNTIPKREKERREGREGWRIRWEEVLSIEWDDEGRIDLPPHPPSLPLSLYSIDSMIAYNNRRQVEEMKIY